jgi:hypothetical protein
MAKQAGGNCKVSKHLRFKKISNEGSPRMKQCRLFFALLALIAALYGLAAAQAAPAQSGSEEKGFTSYVQFAGTSNSDGQVYKLDPSVATTSANISERT